MKAQKFKTKKRTTGQVVYDHVSLVYSSESWHRAKQKQQQK